MQEQALPAIQKAEPEEIVVEEGCTGVEQYIPEKGQRAAADFAFAVRQFRTERAVAVHVIEVVFQRGVGVVEQCAVGGS